MYKWEKFFYSFKVLKKFENSSIRTMYNEICLIRISIHKHAHTNTRVHAVVVIGFDLRAKHFCTVNLIIKVGSFLEFCFSYFA